MWGELCWGEAETLQHLTEEIVCEVACMSEGTQGKINGVAASLYGFSCRVWFYSPQIEKTKWFYPLEAILGSPKGQDKQSLSVLTRQNFALDQDGARLTKAKEHTQWGRDCSWLVFSLSAGGVFFLLAGVGPHSPLWWAIKKKDSVLRKRRKGSQQQGLCVNTGFNMGIKGFPRCWR